MERTTDTINIKKAEKKQAPVIARLIMTAMTEECCLFYTGEGHSIDDFHKVMTKLVEYDNSQYSYLNTLIATNGNGEILGVCVSYDGSKLHGLRQAFLDMTKEAFGIDHSRMTDETQSGELYADSLAVFPEFRGQGVATALLDATKEKAKKMGISAVGLLVDKGNPNAERLYNKLGFKYVNDSDWGGHPMKHLQYNV